MIFVLGVDFGELSVVSCSQTTAKDEPSVGSMLHLSQKTKVERLEHHNLKLPPIYILICNYSLQEWTNKM